MHIGILVLAVGLYGKKGMYNTQEVGLGKELGKRGHIVDIYKCANSSYDKNIDQISENVIFSPIVVRTIGNNSVFSCERTLNRTWDMLICFSDIQLMTKSVSKWARKHNILFIPYVGIAHSTSTSTIKKTLIDLCARSAYNTYRKTGVLVKTNTVRQELIAKGINNIRVAPVGLDFGLLNSAYNEVKNDVLLRQLELDRRSKYILMVGRIENDRNPLDVVHVFERVHRTDVEYKLIILGKGSLKRELLQNLDEHGLKEYIIWIDQIPNSEMWKYYRISSALISFSRTEIFGMSILEAMYYELPVLVIHAPGPDDIIIDKENGYLFNTPDEMAEEIIRGIDQEIGKKAHKHIVNNFSWSNTADCIEQIYKIGY